MKSNLDAFDQQGRIFWGAEYYPYGIDRSGEFTRQQVELLKAHGFAYEALAKGEKKPINPEEKQFVKACQGQVAAEGTHEKLWLRFVKCSARHTEFVSMGAAPSVNDTIIPNTEDLSGLG